jgi:hypothetical protein
MGMMYHFDKKDKDFSLITMQLDHMSFFLDDLKEEVQSKRNKSRINQINRLLSDLIDNMEKEENSYLNSSKMREKEKIKILTEEERYRTNYNHSTDGRMKNTLYGGNFGLGKKR